MINHIENECTDSRNPKRIWHCQYEMVGCNYAGTLNEMKAHTDDLAMHLLIACKRIEELEKKVNSVL